MNFTRNNSLKNFTAVLYRHTDEYGNNICEEIENELKQVIDREIILEQVPHPHLGICVIYSEKHLIDGSIKNIALKEIDIKSTIYNKNEIKIDYNTGKITVHHSLEGKFLNISYWGLGYNLIHSSRVYTKLDEHGNIVQTLDDLVKIILQLGDTEFIVRLLQEIEKAKVSIINGIEYSNVAERLESIEQSIKDYLDDILTMNTTIEGIVSNMDEVKNIALDVDYRMGVLENNYLNPNFATFEDINSIIGGLE